MGACAYCDTATDNCTVGCAANPNCAGYDAVCTVSDHDDCFYCDAHDCLQGCGSDANCPDVYPVCGAGGPHRCGCSSDGDCKVGYFCDSGTPPKCTAPPGKVLLSSIKVYSQGCTGCTSEGTEVILLGERNANFLTGVPCKTGTLDIPGSTEYGPGGEFEFGSMYDKELGTCYEAALNSEIRGGTVTWLGTGQWSPQQVDAGLCMDWTDPAAFVWLCDLSGPASGGTGTVWTLINCDVMFSVSCPPPWNVTITTPLPGGRW